MLKNDETANVDSPDYAALSREIKDVLLDIPGTDAVLLDLTGFNIWTDYFVIATVSSTTNMDGLKFAAEDWAKKSGLEIRRGRGKTNAYTRGAPSSDDRDLLWTIIDMGNIVVHLMSKDARDFYDLERLWTLIP
jgi:ribosome-associated protein